MIHLCKLQNIFWISAINRHYIFLFDFGTKCDLDIVSSNFFFFSTIVVALFFFNFSTGSALFMMHFRFLVTRWRNTQLWQAHKTGSKTLQRITTSTVSSLYLARLSLSALAHRDALISRRHPSGHIPKITKTNGCWHQQFHFLIHLIPPLWCWGDVPEIRHHCLLNKPSDGALSLLPQKWP